MNQKIKYFILGTVTFIFFLVFTLIVKYKLISHLDFNSTIKIQYHIPRSLDSFLSLFSLLGSFEVLTLILIAVLIISKKTRNFLILAFFLFGHLVEILGKSFLNHPGPPYLFFRYDLDFLFPSSYIQAGSSYPSGHSFRTVFLAVIFIALTAYIKKISHKKKQLLISAIAVFTLIMLISRVSLGEHWFSDVLGGTLLGLSYGFFSLLVI